jgi:hypothetical protein
VKQMTYRFCRMWLWISLVALFSGTGLAVTVEETITAYQNDVGEEDGNTYLRDWMAVGDWTDNASNDWVEHAGFQFVDLDLPQGVSIDSATLYVTTLEWDLAGLDPGEAIVKGHKVTDSADFIEGIGTYDVTGRTPQTAGVLAPAFPAAIGEVAIPCTAVIQELVDQGGWTPSSPVTLLLLNNGAAEGHSVVFYKAENGEHQPRITVEYSFGPPPTPPPPATGVEHWAPYR